MSQEGDYFEAYEDLKVHYLLLKDEQRINAYEDAINGCKEQFAGKVVLDVGAGTGILSILAARAGARKVYAVEGAPRLAKLCEKVVQDNGYADVITVLDCLIEEVELPEKADIIVSEWMGFYLLHECMLQSVLHARKFLREGGLMFPESCTLFAALTQVPALYQFWKDVRGVDMSAIGEEYRKSAGDKPDVRKLRVDDLMSAPKAILSLDLYKCDPLDLAKFEEKVFTTASRDGPVQGLCLWFDVYFPSGFKLSTSPYDPPTHWKQTVIMLPYELNCAEDDPVIYSMTLIELLTNRTYTFEVEIIDPTDETHPIPCDCNYTQCIVAKAYYESTENQEQEIEPDTVPSIKG